MKNFSLFIFSLLLSMVVKAQIIPNNFRFYVDEGRRLIVCNQLPTSDQISGNPIQIKFGNKAFTFPSNINTLGYGVKYSIMNEGIEYTLYFSQLPVVNLDVSNPNNINTEEEIEGKISLADQEHAPIESNMAIRIRGNSSAFFPKKNYRVQFKDEAGKNKDVSILGLRSDKRWLFFGMWNEEIRATNNVSHNLWIDMHKLHYAASEPSAIASIRTKYVEVFMNNSYKGVYMIGEDLDRKQLQLKKNEGDITKGELYKADDWSLSVTFAGIGAPKPSLGTEKWQSWEFDYPDNKNWDNHYQFLQDVIQSSDEVFQNTIYNNLTQESLIDYFIFVNVMLAEDNLGRNYFLAKYNAGEPLFFVPWDLDATWGYLGNGTRTNLTEGERTTDLFKRLMRLNPGGFKTKLAARYFALRQTLLTESGLKGRFLNNYNLLSSNLVYERDAAVSGDQYGGADRSSGLNYINNFITKRLAWLDNYFCTMLDGGCNVPGTCAFEITANASNTSPACSESVTLSSGCIGADCAGVTYTWTGNGMNQTGASITMTAPSVNGSYIYTVKASKNGCADKMATLTLNITDCTPPVGNDPFSLCLEAENQDGNGPVTGDPNASNGKTRGDKDNYNHYVDYAVNGVKVTGTHQMKISYYANGAAQVSISVNGNTVIPSVALPPTYSWNIVRREETINLTLNPGNNVVRVQGLPGFSVRQDKICITGPGGQNPQEPACAFDISANASASAPDCSAPVTLSSGCTGPDCSGITYSWTGNGINQSGNAINITAPGTNGSYVYNVKATKNGCTEKTATIALNIANCTPPVGNDPFSLCLEAENQDGNGSVTGDPNASNGKTRGEKDNYNHYVDYAVNGVKATGTHRILLRYYANGPAQASVSVNGNIVLPAASFPPTNSWNIVGREEMVIVTLNQGNNTVRIQGLPGYSIRQDKICVTGPGNGNPQEPASCEFAVHPGSSNNDPSCSSPITLSTGCTGKDCNSLSYAWTGPGVNQSGRTIDMITPPATGSYVYAVTASKSGCSSQTLNLTLNVNRCDPPVGGDFNLCLESEIQNGNGLVTSDPNASNGNTRGEKSNSDHYVDYVVNGVPAAGVYQLKLRYAASSNPNVSVIVNNVTAIVSRNLPATSSWNIVFREEIFNVTLAAGNNTIRIQGLNGPSIRQDKICVTSMSGNARMAAPELVQEQASSDENLNVFPNPAPGAFYAKFSLRNGEAGNITVTDVKGRVWHSSTVTGNGAHEEKITLPNAPSGMYLLQIKSGKNTENKKLLITQ